MTISNEYKQGVLDATANATFEELVSITKAAAAEEADVEIDRIFVNRRKKLLAKKVIKWFNVYSSPTGPQTGFSSSTGSNLYDSEEEALSFREPLENQTGIIGTYSVEIEVPYDGN